MAKANSGADKSKYSELTQAELARYSRHLLLPELGIDGQRKLKSARVLVVGAGGLGCPVVAYLAAAGVGKLGVVDFDAVEISNLQRQVLFTSDAVGQPKAELACAFARALNPAVDACPHVVKFSAVNAMELLAGYDLVVDASDNFPTRYLVNDACVLAGKPNVQGSVFRFEGQATVFVPGAGPCYRCLFKEASAPDMVPNCAAGGVLGAVAGVIGSVQASEAVKHIAGIGDSLKGRLLIFDALRMAFDFVSIKSDPECQVCSKNATIKSLDHHREPDPPCAEESVLSQKTTITAAELAQALAGADQPLLLDVRRHEEVLVGNIPGSMHIPLDELETRHKELDKEREIVVYCRSGVRSRQAIGILRQKGFEKLLNLTGGISAYSRDVDPGITVA